MSWEPPRRRDGAWPNDRAIRWPGVARGLAWLVVGTGALVAQLVLVVPLWVVAHGPIGSSLSGLTGPLLALGWGALTLWAAWAWVLGRWRVAAAPIVTAMSLWVATQLG